VPERDSDGHRKGYPSTYVGPCAKGMAYADSERIGDVVRLWHFSQIKHPHHHKLHLLYVRLARARHGGLDLRRRKFRPRQARFSGGE
jgi:hypothetical protein